MSLLFSKTKLLRPLPKRFNLDLMCGRSDEFIGMNIIIVSIVYWFGLFLKGKYREHRPKWRIQYYLRHRSKNLKKWFISMNFGIYCCLFVRNAYNSIRNLYLYENNVRKKLLSEVWLVPLFIHRPYYHYSMYICSKWSIDNN